MFSQAVNAASAQAVETKRKETCCRPRLLLSYYHYYIDLLEAVAEIIIII
jgi:hypothetical protein